MFIFMLLLFMLFITSTAIAQLLLGANNDCQGWDISASKYCPRFGNTLLGPVNFTDILFAAMVRSPSNAEDMQFVKTLNLENVQSVQEFDSKIMTGLILKNMEDLNNRWFRCRFATRGVQYSISWFCNLLLNSPISSCPKPNAPNPTSLCQESLTQTFKSAFSNSKFDSSCKDLDQTTFQAQLNQVYSTYFQFNRTSSLDGQTCINSADNERERYFCGYATKEIGCQNDCKESSCPLFGNAAPLVDNQDSPWPSSTLFISLCVLGGAFTMLAILGTTFVFHRRRMRLMNKIGHQHPTTNSIGNIPTTLNSLNEKSGGDSRNPVSVESQLGFQHGSNKRHIPQHISTDRSILSPPSEPSPNLFSSTPTTGSSQNRFLQSPISANPSGTRRLPTNQNIRISSLSTISFLNDEDGFLISPEDSASNIGVKVDVLPPNPQPSSSTTLVSGGDRVVTLKDAKAAVHNTLPKQGRVFLPNGTVAYRVYDTYHPILDDELGISPDSLVLVDFVFSDGWVHGSVCDPVSGELLGTPGVFPLAVLEPVS